MPSREARTWWRALAPLVVGSATLLTAGCVTTTDTVVTDAACEAWEPVSWSTSDTDQTIREAKANNAAWGAYCE